MLENLMIDAFKNNKEYNCFLAKTGPLKHFHKDISALLKYYYNASGFESRAASLINSLFYQNLQTFMFCRKTMARLYSQDPLSPYRTLNNRDYGMFLKTIINSPDFEVLRLPTGSKAGVYKLVKPELVSLLHQNCSQKYFEAQEIFAIEYFDTDGNNIKEEKIKKIKDKKQESLDRIKANAAKKVSKK